MAGVRPTRWQDRFWRYVTAVASDECWEWHGSTDKHGYGRLNQGGKNGPILKAHRASWEIHNGPIPTGAVVRHGCDNPPCVNPAHLQLGTHQDNSRDMAARGRSAAQRGHSNRREKVSDETVRAVRERAATGEQHHIIAADFGVSARWVGAVAAGQRRLRAGGPISQLRDHHTGRWADRRSAPP